MKKRKILISVTTTRGADWRKTLKDVKKFGLKEIALFPTCLEAKERKEMYALLEKSGIKSIPVLHLRTDMPIEELDFFRKKYKTKIFIIHTQREYPLMCDWAAYKRLIYVENVYNVFDEGELKEFAGICLDITHLENDRVVAPERFKKNFDVELIAGNVATAEGAAALVNAGADGIKLGAPARGERTAKYNRLLEIERFEKK